MDPERLVDTDGEHVETPRRLDGISGSSIWRAYAYGEDPSTWTAAAARVAAVQTCIVNIKGSVLIRGTRWYMVLAMLRDRYPDLASAIELHNPGPVRATFTWKEMT